MNSLITKDYRCNDCDHLFTVRQKINDKNPKCELCGGETHWKPTLNANEHMVSYDLRVLCDGIEGLTR